MKKEYKLLAFLFLGLFVTSILAISFVSAATVGEVGEDIIQKLFGTTLTGAGVFDLAITKILLFILITLIVYTLSEFLPFVKNKWYIEWPISIIIAYLAVIYIAPAEIYASLIGWGAFAVTITVLIPFALIIALIYKSSRAPTTGTLFIAKFVEIVFALYITYRVVAYVIANLGQDLLITNVIVIYGISLIAIILILIFDKNIRSFLVRQEVNSFISQADMLSKAEITAKVSELNDRIIGSIKVHGLPTSQNGPNTFVDALINARDALNKYASHAK